MNGFDGRAQESEQSDLATLQESLQIERSELAALFRMTQVINSSLDLDQVLNHVMHQIIFCPKPGRF